MALAQSAGESALPARTLRGCFEIVRPLAALRLLAALCLLVVLCGAGCVHVHPWEREHLARLERHGERRSGAREYEAHFWMVRESPVGATGAPGGGCGCN